MSAFLRAIGVGLIPLLSLIGLVSGAGVLCWYSQLSPEDKAKANAIAEDYAMELYNKTRSQLSGPEANHVDILTLRHFASGKKH
jgi:hypothetical protein